MDGLNIHIYIGIYVYISEENKGKEIHKPLNFIMFVMNPLKLLTAWLLESQPVIFQTQQLRCICVLKSHLRYENRICEVEVADAFWSRRCVLKSQLRFENESAAWTSQMRFSHRRCEIDIAAAERSQTLTSAGLCGTHISETTGWIYTIWSSMELSTPVVVQHLGHLTLTWDFPGQILKMLYLRNGRADWHETKGMWIDRMLHTLCNFQRSPHPWPWAWILKVKFWKSRISGMG